MKKLIILIEILIIIILLQMSFKVEFPIIIGEAESSKVSDMIYTKKPKPKKYFLMNITFYSQHPDCISNKWNDGYTATMTPIRKGVVAINVDYINDRWVVKSPLRLGDKVYIEGLGEYSVEDTGQFSERDNIQDIYTVDVFEPDHQRAILGGKQLKKVYVLD